MNINFSVLMSLYYKETPSNFDICLQSILQQSLTPSEIIIVLDGPLSKELNIYINNLNLNNPILIKLIPIFKNIGLGAALNLGLQHCSNEWIFRMDTDDFCTPDRFKKQLEYINNNADLVLLGSYTEEFDSLLSHSIGYRKVPCSHSDIISYIKRRNPFNHMTVAFRKDVIQSVGGYEHHLYMEDYNLWIRVIAAGHQVGNIDEVLVNVRGGDSMIKRRKGLTYIKSELQLAKLKIEKNIDSPLSAYLNFIIRSIPRLLPTYMLSKIYKKLRK